MKKLIFLTVLSLIVVLANSAFGSPVLSPYNGHYYEIYYAERIMQGLASFNCMDMSYMGVQGHLVTIMDVYEQEFVNELRLNLFKTLNNEQSELGTCWIGLYREEPHVKPTTWQWVTGEYINALGPDYSWFYHDQGCEVTYEYYAWMRNWPWPDDDDYSGRWESVGNGIAAYASSYIVEYDGPFSVIPEPGAILLGSIGVGLVGWLRRRMML